jgi:sensor histidine kinase YesM
MIPFSISWFVWICVHQLALYQMGLDWFSALTDSIISNTLLIYVALLLFTIFRFHLPRKQGFLNLFTWLVLLTTGWFFINEWVMNFFLKENVAYQSLMKNTWPLRIATAFLINGCVSLIGYAYYNWRERNEAEKQKTEAEKLSRDAELYKLRQQLQPHFLFNALNSINALIGSRPAEARNMVQQLSEFLRTTLKKEEQQWVKLEEEIHSLQLYLDIEKVRFGNRLETHIEINADAMNMQLPALLLQPLVENALKFGLYDTTGRTLIQLKADAEQGQLLITVENPFDAETSSAQKGTGFGLNSVQRRLFLLCGRNDLLQTEAKENIFITKVLIPQPVTQGSKGTTEQQL